MIRRLRLLEIPHTLEPPNGMDNDDDSKTTPRWIASVLGSTCPRITGCLWSVGDVTGARAEGDRLKRMAASPQWDPEDERFTNELERIDGN